MTTENYCHNCDSVINCEVDEKKFYNKEIGLMKCPECGSIVYPCNECEEKSKACGNCLYERSDFMKIVKVNGKEVISWTDKYINLKNKVISRISEIIEILLKDKKEEELDVSDYELSMYIQDNFTNEYFMIKVKKCDGVMIRYVSNIGEENEIDLDEIDLNELVAFCDYLEKKI